MTITAVSGIAERNVVIFCTPARLLNKRNPREGVAYHGARVARASLIYLSVSLQIVDNWRVLAFPCTQIPLSTKSTWLGEGPCLGKTGDMRNPSCGFEAYESKGC